MSEFKPIADTPVGKKLVEIRKLLVEEALPSIVKRLEDIKKTVSVMTEAHKKMHPRGKDG